ncbi:MAG: lysS, partial [Chlamydiales bacterium]|nr:lysS [Chlamydiales bacterium]
MTDLPTYQQSEEFKNRLRKLQEIQDAGIDPFPAKFTPNIRQDQLAERYKDFQATSEQAEAGDTDYLFISGRLVLFRAMGKNAFAHLQDSTGRIQVMFNRDQIQISGYQPEGDQLAPLKWIEKKLDLGDIIGVEGHLFRTHKGELTLFARKLTLLSKALLPLADKHSGLSDKETRYRKRWLDLICNEEVKDTFLKRSQIFKLIRAFFDRYEFMEVETPVLQGIYGGAEARPFITELNALDQTMYLRIALEISLKKLIIGGMERVFEIGKVFRNEGIDRTHNPEFTVVEAYAAYW